MATQTMRDDRRYNPDGTLRSANQPLYWAIGAVVVLALVIFFAMRNRPADTATTPVERSSVTDTTTTTTTGTAAGVNGAAGVNNGTSDLGTGAATTPVQNEGVYEGQASDPAMSSANGATGDTGTGADASPTRQ